MCSTLNCLVHKTSYINKLALPYIAFYVKSVCKFANPKMSTPKEVMCGYDGVFHTEGEISLYTPTKLNYKLVNEQK